MNTEVSSQRPQETAEGYFMRIGDTIGWAEATKRVRSHPQLLEALQDAEQADEYRQPFDDLALFTDDPVTEPEYRDEYNRRKMQREAIAQATA